MSEDQQVNSSKIRIENIASRMSVMLDGQIVSSILSFIMACSLLAFYRDRVSYLILTWFGSQFIGATLRIIAVKYYQSLTKSIQKYSFYTYFEKFYCGVILITAVNWGFVLYVFYPVSSRDELVLPLLYPVAVLVAGTIKLNTSLKTAMTYIFGVTLVYTSYFVFHWNSISLTMIFAGLIFSLFLVFAAKQNFKNFCGLESSLRYLKEKSQLQERLNEQEKVTLQANKLASIGELASGIGHEINNPLTISNGMIKKISKSLEYNNSMTEDIRTFFNTQVIANEKIRIIVDGLSLYSRNDDDKESEVCINHSLVQTTEFVREILNNNQIELEMNLAKEDYYIMASNGKLQQVFMNIIINAKDALEGQKHKKITININENSQKRVVLEISDNGEGITDEDKEKIFDIFFTTKPVGVGTGLGLNIVAKIIKSFNGEIEVDSEIEKGTTFRISFPFIEQRLCQFNYSASKRKAFSGEVLILDDEEHIGEFLADELEDLGLNSDIATTGLEALEKMRLKSYDFVFSDMRMPEMNGEEFITQAKLLPNGNTTYFIMSGGMPPQQQEKVLKLVHGHVKKPFNSDALFELINIYKKIA